MAARAHRGGSRRIRDQGRRTERGEQGDLSLAARLGGGGEAFLPPTAPAGTPAGRVTRAVSGLRHAVLTVAGHDHLCASVGAGIVPSEVFDSCGTAEAVLRSVRSPLDPRTMIEAAGQ